MTALYWILGIVGYLALGLITGKLFVRAVGLQGREWLELFEIGFLVILWPVVVAGMTIAGIIIGLGRLAR